MADRPILFSGPMVRALLDGRKTQTRRIAKFVEPQGGGWHVHDAHGGMFTCTDDDVRNDGPSYAPIQAGDRLWVRESWSHTGNGVWSVGNARMSGRGGVIYRADDDRLGAGWFPSIHMPREFSRLTLIVTDVRVQRLQEISEEDARAEGIFRWERLCDGSMAEREVWAHYEHAPGLAGSATARDAFSWLWKSINGPDAWQANPFVAAYTFTLHHHNIDATRATDGRGE